MAVHSRWSSPLALLPGVPAKKVATGGGGIDCVSMNEVSIWKTYGRLFVKMILNDSRPVSLNWGSGCCALLADAARMGGLRTGGASHPPGFT